MSLHQTVTSVETPPIASDDRQAPFNRPPLAANPLARLPLGSIRPAGWLKHQLDLMVEGMTGRLAEISDFLRPDNGWFGGDNPGWEEQPYWLRGFYSLAALTREESLLAEAGRWIEAVISSQDGDGYFGASYHKCVTGKNGQRTCDLWPHMVMLDALVRHYEYANDSRVITLMTRFFRFCQSLPEDRFIPKLQEGFGDWQPAIQSARAGDMLPHLFWLYNRTEEQWLLELATRFYRRITPPTDEWLDHHVIHFSQRWSYPGVYSALSGESWHLALSEYWYAQHLGTWGQQPRGIFGADEVIRTGCVDPRQGFETCGFGEFAKTFYLLGQLTGSAVYADRCEDLLFNHFPASLTPDLKALHYLTASNQPQLDASERHEYTNKGRQISYSPHRVYRCCQHNVAMTWPWYAENLWQATADRGLAAWLYASCEVTAEVGAGREVRIRETTDYPFRGDVEITIESSEALLFPIYLRVPRWCSQFSAAVNGKRVEATPQPGHYLRIEREWRPGDAITIAVPMELSLTAWPRTGSVTVDRGPLSYSVRIGERWQRCGGTDKWPEWEVFPTAPWNYGLILDRQHPREGLQLVEKAGRLADQPWTIEDAPLEIRARAKRIPNWGMENETAAELQISPIRSSEPEERISLIPLGCARLRLACLPTIGEGLDAQPWRAVAKA